MGRAASLETKEAPEQGGGTGRGSDVDYYSEHLSGARLRACYEAAPPRVRRYLRAEIEAVLEDVEPDHAVLELGCGYGRVLGRLAARCRLAVGIDLSAGSLRLARERLAGLPSCRLLFSDATALAFRDGSFDRVVCIQNGIAAFGVNRLTLVTEAVRATRHGGKVVLSSYAPAFWPHRLEWFRIQSEKGLVGEIDEGATGNGVIVCKDGFSAGALDAPGFRDLTAPLGLPVSVREVDGSSVFCEIRVEAASGR